MVGVKESGNGQPEDDEKNVIEVGSTAGLKCVVLLVLICVVGVVGGGVGVGVGGGCVGHCPLSINGIVGGQQSLKG